MNIVGGILLYLGSLSVLLAAAAIAAGTLLSDPGGGPAVTAQAAPPPLVRARDAKPPRKLKEGAQDVAKLLPVAPPASAITVRPTVDRSLVTGRPTRAVAAKRPKKARRAPSRLAAEPAPNGTLGFAPTEPRPSPFFPHRR
jgi:hypothetical protein